MPHRLCRGALLNALMQQHRPRCAPTLFWHHAAAMSTAASAAAATSSSPSGSDPSEGGTNSSTLATAASNLHGSKEPPPFKFDPRDTDLNVPLPSLRYPVVLVHGYLGYASLIRSPWPWSGPLLEYFGSVRSHLGESSKGGIAVITPVNPPAASIAARAHKMLWALGLQSHKEEHEAAAKGKTVREKDVAGSSEHTERQVTGPGNGNRNGNGNGNVDFNGVKGDPSFIEFAHTAGGFDPKKHRSDSATLEQHRAEERAGRALPAEPSPGFGAKLPPSAGTSIILGGQRINLDEYDGKFHLIAHSMGGLDCRYFISQLQAAGEKSGDPTLASRRIASLTTIGTPHRGSPVADMILDVIDVPMTFRSGHEALAAAPTVNKLSQRLAGWFGIDVSGISNLSTQAMRGFNERVKNVDGVTYQSIGGSQRFPWWNIWHLPSKWIRDFAQFHDHTQDGEDGLCAGGENDGLVSVSSAQWGHYLGTTELDHLEQIGLGVWHKHLPLYRNLAFRLKDIEEREARTGREQPGKEQAERPGKQGDTERTTTG